MTRLEVVTHCQHLRSYEAPNRDYYGSLLPGIHICTIVVYIHMQLYGERLHMNSRFVTACASHHLSSRAAYYGVFDGHAGPRASEYTAQHLHKNILAKFPKGELQ